jgi:eukaryotic-like serine/threonine-protein kinase
LTLTDGQRLGPYQILAAIGAGGMGEIYKAHDTRLDRIVAIKVLPALYEHNQDIRSRFEREAKAISRLNHPNICTLHDIGQENGTGYLVLEYLEGDTLATRLKKGALSPVELITYATQIADALERAHKQGLVHRDLKPANIMLAKDGAKLLDFGLAKLQVKEGIVEGVEGATRTTPLTGEGTIIGTLQYMAPEQLEGKEADHRSDIFAFGAVLYEMATGQRAFQGSSQASLIAAILKEEPRPISELQPMSPPMLDRAIRQCLAKDPDQRWQSAGDLKRALQWASEGGSQVGIPLPVSRRRKSREKTLWIVCGILFFVASTLAGIHFTQRISKPKVARFIMSAPTGLTAVSWPQLSPDGNTLAFVALDTNGQAGIYLRPLNSIEAHLLVKTQNTNSRPFWSPDSKQLAFFENTTQLKKISLAGGMAQLVCEAQMGVDGSWGSGGVIIFDGGQTDSIRQVPAAGGTPAAASRIDHTDKEKMNGWPCFLPDGEHFLFIALKDTSGGEWTLKVGSIKSLEAMALTTVDSRVTYANGHILYVKNNLLVAHQFDTDNLKLIGEPIPLTSSIAALAERALFSASDDGTLIFQRGHAGSQHLIVSVDRRGDSAVQIGPLAPYGCFALSPDNNRLAYEMASDQQNLMDIWVRDLRRNVASRLTFGPGINGWPIWNYDGSKVLFTSNRTASRFCVMQRNANGTGTDEKLLANDSLDISATDASSSGSRFVLQASSNNEDLWIHDMATGKTEQLLTQPYSEQRGVLSPDGRLIAYQSNETREAEIYIRELTPTGGKWQVSTTHGRCPKWRADGKELYYITYDYDFMAVPISYDKGLEIGTPVKLFNHRFVFSGTQTLSPYAPTSDGKRFYILSPTDQSKTSEFVVVQNWVEELKK